MTDRPKEDRLTILSRTSVPAPSAAARQRALAAADLAFAEAQKDSSSATQGRGLFARLKSMVPNRGNWIMDMRIPLGTAAAALLLLPIGWQLYSSTAITQPWLDPAPVVTDQDTTGPVVTQNVAPQEPLPTAEAQQSKAEAQPPAEQLLPRAEQPVTTATADQAESPIAPQQGQVGRLQRAAPASIAEESETAERVAVPQGQDLSLALPAPEPESFAAGAVAGGATAESAAMPMQSGAGPGGSGDTFTAFEESPVKVVAEAPVSTFSIDVDTASYSYVRSVLLDGYRPQADAVRIEELINYFPYNYAVPEDASTPFRPSMAIYPTPWNPKTQILQIGIKGYVPPAEVATPSNLVFLIDTSGSMDEPDKLPLLKRAFVLLVEQLGATDTVSIVVYAGSAGIVLEPTPASDKARILAALDNLAAGGSTAGAEGIELAYRLAEQAKISDGINRVILATDGDFNVGISDPNQLDDFIKAKRDAGVFLSVLGFGRGNLDDATMQALAQNGNGNAAYIDSFREAQKVLVEERLGTLQTIAKDVKIQAEFNPALVSEYRLIGYETRALNREDFNNDKVDAGEIGAGHTVTALYEITPVGSGAELVEPLRFGTAQPGAAGNGSTELGYLKLRYKLPNSDTSTLVETPIGRDLVRADISAVPEDMRFAAAVAAFGQKLKGSDYAGDITYERIRQLALGARGPDENGYRSEFVQLIRQAERLEAGN